MEFVKVKSEILNKNFFRIKKTNELFNIAIYIDDNLSDSIILKTLSNNGKNLQIMSIFKYYIRKLKESSVSPDILNLKMDKDNYIKILINESENVVVRFFTNNEISNPPQNLKMICIDKSSESFSLFKDIYNSMANDKH